MWKGKKIADENCDYGLYENACLRVGGLEYTSVGVGKEIRNSLQLENIILVANGFQEKILGFWLFLPLYLSTTLPLCCREQRVKRVAFLGHQCTIVSKQHQTLSCINHC
jgi:hypothetical protein